MSTLFMSMYNSDKQFQVDELDIVLVSSWNWSISPQGYVRCLDGRNWLLLHRMLLGAVGKIEVDHIDGNPLNNCRSNLRLVSRQQNAQNQKARGECGYKGVIFECRTGKFVARVCHNYKTIYLGTFLTAEQAALRYNEEAVKLFGSGAKLNLVPTC